MNLQPLLILGLAFVALPIAVRVVAEVSDRIERWIAHSRFKDTFKHVS